MAAKVDLDGRGEPTQQIILALGYEERGFGKVVLGGYRLHRRLRQPFGERAHRRRIAAEQAAGKGVDLIERNAHDGLSRVMDYSNPDTWRMPARASEERRKDEGCDHGSGCRWRHLGCPRCSETRRHRRPCACPGLCLL